MDNKNQSNNSVGDTSKFSHENQLPPIWDNISKELNALDEDAMPLDNQTVDSNELSDLADFSIVKESFQTNFSTKEPPKFMWDKIEQDLESFTVTDDPSTFSAIKDGFEQNYKETSVPNFTWADLAEEMDNPKPKEKVEDYAFVKRGFEKQYSAVVVPLFSWDDLAKRMDNEAALADTPDRYSIVKDSFQKVYANNQPAADTWANLEQQLQSNSHWKKIGLLLSAPAFLKKAALFTAIGVFMLGSKFYLTNESTPISIPASSVIASNQEPQKETTAKDLFHKIHESSLNAAGHRSHTEETSEKVLPLSDALYSDDVTTESSENTPSSLENNKEQDGSNVQNHFTQTVGKDTPNNTGNSSNTTGTVANEQDLLYQEDEIKPKVEQSIHTSDLNWIGQAGVNVEAFDKGVNVLVQDFILDSEITKMDEDNFTLVRQAQKGKKIRFEVGLTGKGGTSILLGQNKYETWNNGEPTHLCPTGAFGIMANYHFTLNDAVVLGIYPYSSMKQCFGKYDNNGNYEATDIDLSLFDFTLGYQRTLIRYNSLSQIPSKIYARLDFGLGILTNAKTKVNEQVISSEKLYNKFNFSAGLALGNAHEINQFIIDYGITSNIGVNNLITGSNPTILQPAQLLNIGAYLGVRYILVPRLEPSKKQRQFDWSPPFYIEEPAF